MVTDEKQARADAKAAKARAKALRPWYRKKRWWTLGVAAVLVIIGVASGGSKNSPSSSNVAATSPPPTASPAVAAAAPASGPIFQQSGSGTQQTTRFNVPSDWNLAWSYSCASFGYPGNFAVSVGQSQGSMASLEDIPIDQSGTGASGVQHYHYGGNVYLSIDSECSWTVTVSGA